MTEPDPFVSADLDLRDFRWMKLDLIALFNSDFNATPDDTAWRAGVTLWGKAWHQVPAGSLPDDDARLCNLAGLGRDVRTWKRIREQALHGFTRCSDGRLYHKFLCDMATEAAAERDRYAKRREADRARKVGRNSDGIPPEPTRQEPLVPPELPTEIPIEGEGQGQGQGDSPTVSIETFGEGGRASAPSSPPKEFVIDDDLLAEAAAEREKAGKRKTNLYAEKRTYELKTPPEKRSREGWLSWAIKAWTIGHEEEEAAAEVPPAEHREPKPIDPKMLGHKLPCSCGNCTRWAQQSQAAA